MEERLFEVPVPSGIPPGHNFTVMANGRQVTVTVPPNTSAGDAVSFQVPISPPAANTCSSIPQQFDSGGVAKPKAEALKSVGKGCCRCCGQYKCGKQACVRCGYKYCLDCSQTYAVWFPGECTNCKEQEEALVDMAAPKGCCSGCFGQASNKRPCISCGKKYCDKCILWNLGKEKCSQCMTPTSPYEEPIYGYAECAHCKTAPGTDALRCVVCGKRYCGACEASALGDKSEGMKCVSCVGEKPHQAVIPVPPVQASATFKSIPCHSITVNGQPLNEIQLWILLCEPLAFAFLRAGKWWYDKRSGWLGKLGKGPKAVIRPGLEFGTTGEAVMDPNCAGGTTGIFLNGRQIVENEKLKYSLASVNLTPGSWFYEHNGDYGPLTGPDAGKVHGNFWKKGGRNLAIGLGLAVVGFAGAEALGCGESFGGGAGVEHIEGSGMIGTTSDGRTIISGLNGPSAMMG